MLAISFLFLMFFIFSMLFCPKPRRFRHKHQRFLRYKAQVMDVFITVKLPAWVSEEKGREDAVALL